MSRAPEGRSVLRVISAMLNDVSFPAIAAVHSGSVPVTEQKAQAADLTQAVPPVTPVINPTLRLDAALGLVVIEFRNDSGAITTSIPSQRQLQEYQRWQTTRVGPTQAGVISLQSQTSTAAAAIDSIANIQPDGRKKD